MALCLHVGSSEKCDGRLLKFEISNRKLTISAIDIGWAHTKTKLMNIVTCYLVTIMTTGAACERGLFSQDGQFSPSYGFWF